jgi:SAM-dependent methyltransferase
MTAYSLKSELEWWEEHFARHTNIGDALQRQSAFPAPLLSFIQEIQQRKHDRPQLLEIGPGPLSILAWGVEENLFRITSLDPLATRYRQLLGKHGLDYPVKPIDGYAEKLLDYFDRESFDIVYSSNALDHVMSPRKCLHNICMVVRRDGIVCLEGFCREGTNGRWLGLHQHDLVPDTGHWLTFNTQGKRSNLTAELNLDCVYENVVPFHERGITAFGQEPEEAGTISPWHYTDWYTMIFSRSR